MKRCYSLKKNRDFQFTYRMGKSVGCRLCVLVYVRDRRKKKAPRNNSPLPAPNVRVGFCVSKKVGNSVIRNRAKRRLRAALAPHIPTLRSGYNLIFVARGAVLDEPFEALCASVARLLEKAGLVGKAS